MLAFLIGIGVFAVGFGALLEAGVLQGNLGSGHASSVAEGAGAEAAAGTLADRLLGQPGVGWYTSLSCTNGVPNASKLQPDAVRGLGLGHEPCPGGVRGPGFALEYQKLQKMRGGLMTAAATNGYIDYPEARAELGLTGDPANFHVRSWPVLPSIRELLKSGQGDPNALVAYIGHYDTIHGGLVQNYVVQKACGSTDGPSSAVAWVDITNNGTTAAAFEVTFTVRLASDDVEFVQHTPPIAAGATQRVSLTLPKTSDWAWAGAAQVTVDVADVLRDLGSCTSSLAGFTMTAATTTRLFGVNAEKLENTLSSGSVTTKIMYAAYDGRGHDLSYSDWQLRLVSSLGVTVGSDTNLNQRGWEPFVLTGPDTVTATLLNGAGTLVLGQDVVNVVATGLGSFTPTAASTTYVPHAGVVPEATYLALLAKNFDPHVYSSTYASTSVPYAAGGDIFPDIKKALNDDLSSYLIAANGAATLANYDVIVVGSDVDQNAMTSAAAKQSIRDWVYAGGFLIVLGSAAQAVQWLEPIFHSGIQSASGGVLNPDGTNPLLHVPNELHYLSYVNNNLTWHYTGSDGSFFEHILTQGGNDVLSTSNPGAFGSGRVLLTSYEPYNLTGSGATGACDPTNVQPDCPALNMLHNFLTLSYADLYLDFGPPIPNGVHVGSVQRLATVYHPQLARWVEIVVLVYAF